jgi:hypothetical protein
MLPSRRALSPPAPELAVDADHHGSSSSLGGPPATLRGQIKRGSLNAVKRGREWHIEEAEVQRYRRESSRAG